jgi:hypothetical protein
MFGEDEFGWRFLWLRRIKFRLMLRRHRREDI